MAPGWQDISYESIAFRMDINPAEKIAGGFEIVPEEIFPPLKEGVWPGSDIGFRINVTAESAEECIRFSSSGALLFQNFIAMLNWLRSPFQPALKLNWSVDSFFEFTQEDDSRGPLVKLAVNTRVTSDWRESCTTEFCGQSKIEFVVRAADSQPLSAFKIALGRFIDVCRNHPEELQ